MDKKDFAELYAGQRVWICDDQGYVQMEGKVVGYHRRDNTVLVERDDKLGAPPGRLDAISYPEWTVPSSSVSTARFEPVQNLRINPNPTMAYGTPFGFDWGDEPTEVPVPKKLSKELCHFPHRCPRCDNAAFVGVTPNSVKCSNRSCLFADTAMPKSETSHSNVWGSR